MRYLIVICFSITMIIVIPASGLGQGAAQLLKQGSSYQAADDTTDRAADLYFQLIKKYPKSVEAEAAQFFLGSYYNRKFFILEKRNKVQDWDSLNKAEEELYKYKGRYPKGYYLADAYHILATIALRRGYRDTAKSWLAAMKQAAPRDRKVYIFRMTWSPTTSDVVKRYCDTASLADANLDAVQKTSSFDEVMMAVTNWARRQCR